MVAERITPSSNSPGGYTGPTLVPQQAFDLTKEAILVRLTIGKFNPKKPSKLIQQESADRHGVNPDLLDAKALIVRREAMAAIVTADGAARSLFRTYTLSWDEKGGYRLCSLKVYDQLTKALRRLERDFWDAADALIEKRDQLAAEAETDLGGIFEDIGFPSKEELKDSFKFELNEMPISDPKDIRLAHVPQERLDEIRNGIRARIEAKISAAQCDLVERLTVVVSNVAEQCSKENPRIFETLIGNVQKMVELIPAMNITGNVDIERLASRARRELASIDCNELKAKPELRAEAVQKANSLLDDLRKFRSK